MPCGVVVCRMRIHASSSRRRWFLSWAELSRIVHCISSGGRSWSVKCVATGELRLRVRMSYLCSCRRVARCRPVSPMYCRVPTQVLKVLKRS